VPHEHSPTAILARFREPVDREILDLLSSRPDTLLYEMVHYHLGLDDAASSGKRVRAALCFLCCEAMGGTTQTAAPAAAAVELVHSFTLLHDDIADRDTTRRGRETVWRRWGIGQAITAGDALFALANLCLTARNPAPDSSLAELNAAVLAVCEGQQLDISYEGRPHITVDEYLAMIDRKTAALFAAACALGARAAEADDRRSAALARFGREIGIGFQIRDDVLGLWGDEKALGKPVGSDLRRNKRSLPIVHALAAAGQAERETLTGLLASGISTDHEAADIASRMEELGARAFCERLAKSSLDRGLQALQEAGPAAAPGEALRTLADYLIERTH